MLHKTASGLGYSKGLSRPCGWLEEKRKIYLDEDVHVVGCTGPVLKFHPKFVSFATKHSTRRKLLEASVFAVDKYKKLRDS